MQDRQKKGTGVFPLRFNNSGPDADFGHSKGRHCNALTKPLQSIANQAKGQPQIPGHCNRAIASLADTQNLDVG